MMTTRCIPFFCLHWQRLFEQAPTWNPKLWFCCYFYGKNFLARHRPAFSDASIDVFGWAVTGAAALHEYSEWWSAAPKHGCSQPAFHSCRISSG
jgi:hypothetical protein